jgi:hypothetical protein
MQVDFLVRTEDRSKLLLPKEPPEEADGGCTPRHNVRTPRQTRGIDYAVSR